MKILTQRTIVLDYASNRTSMEQQDKLTKALEANIREHGRPRFDRFVTVLKKTQIERKDKYVLIHAYLTTCRGLVKEKKELAEEVDTLTNLMHDLDDKCGISDELSPDLDEEEHERILAALDADKLVFAGLLKEGLKSLTKYPEALLLYEYFAGLIYVFNGYQAPLRLNPHLAMRDAMGLSDHYSELLSDIKKELEKEAKEKKQ